MEPARVAIIRDQPRPAETNPTREIFEIYPPKSGRTVPEAVADWMRPLSPSRTAETGVYTFNSYEQGSGRIFVDIRGPISRERLNDQVHVMEIERILGQVQPARLPDAPIWQYAIRIHLRNPYLQLLYGLLIIGGGCIPLYGILVVRDMNAVSSVLFVIVGAILVGAGAYLWVFRGLRRFRWWHRARAVVKRSGEKMPEDLQLFP